MSPGQQAAQVAHAITDLIFQYPEQTARWRQDSNYIIVLAAEDEVQLRALGKKMKDLDISWCVTEEPDLDDAATALAALPNGYSKRLFGTLPLAGR